MDKMWSCEKNLPTSAILCSHRRLRLLGTLKPRYSLAALLACSINDRLLFSVSVVTWANVDIEQRASGSRLLDIQRRSPGRRHVFSTDQRRVPMAWQPRRIISL